jgi:hypothetical protein
MTKPNEFEAAIERRKMTIDELEDSDIGRDPRFTSAAWLPILIFIFAAFFLGAWQLIQIISQFIAGVSGVAS